MKEFLNFLLTLFLDYPQDVNVNEKNMGDNVFLYTITTHNEDTGKVIGREGKIIQAIRNVTKILAIKEGKQIRIEIASAI